MMRVPAGREAELFAVMEGFEPEGSVVIGGYAVSARTIPRYSHDLDLVVSAARADAVREFLAAKQLSRVRQRTAIEQNYGGSWERWQRGKTGPTVDLLAASVQDRAFQVPFPYERVARGAEARALRGLRESAARARVASVEVLIALKVQPMRDRDVGDLACLAGAGFDSAELRRVIQPLLQRAPALLADRIKRFDALLGADDSVAQRFLGGRIPGPPAVRRPYIRAARGLSLLLRGWARP